MSRPRGTSGGWFVAAGLLLSLAAVGAGIIYVETDKGTLRIEALDDDVQVLVEQAGRLVKVLDKNTGGEATLRSGEYTVRVGEKDQHVKVDKDVVRIVRGETEVARIERVPAPSPPSPSTDHEKKSPNGTSSPKQEPPKRPVTEIEWWLDKTKNLPPRRLIKAVEDNLKKRNPRFRGKLIPHNWRGTGLPSNFHLSTEHIKDIKPLRALAHIPNLELTLSSGFADF